MVETVMGNSDNLGSEYETQVESLKIAFKNFNSADLDQLKTVLEDVVNPEVAGQLKEDSGFMEDFKKFLDDHDINDISDENVRRSLITLSGLLGVEQQSETGGKKIVDSDNNRGVDDRPEDAGTIPPLDMGDGRIYSPYTGDELPKVSGATLYEINVSTSGGSSIEYKKGNVTECLMVVENYPGTTFKVKFDELGNLCPIAENMDSNVKVLLNNVPDCIQYLQNKAPAGSTISWNTRMQDYVITSSNGMVLTIEPSTIAGKWVSSDLGKSLYLLNKANLLRGMNEIANLAIDRDRPQLQYKDNKLYIRLKKDQKRGPDGKGGDRGRDRYPIANNFNGLEEKELDKFVKYYNGEERKDDWDAKEENRDYKKINIISGRAVTGGSSTYSHNWDYVVPQLSNSGGDHSQQSPLDEAKPVTELQLVSLDEPSALGIREKFAIQGGVVVYKSDLNKGYYYESGGKMFCVGYEENCEWKKWEVNGKNYDSYTECVNVCDKGAEKLGELLKNGLSDLINEDEKKDLSISAQDGKYIFKNGEISFPINDEDNILTNVSSFWEVDDYNPSVEDKLKIVYLVSKYVPLGDCSLSVDGNGNIIKSVGSGNSENFITKDDLNEFGLDNDDKKGAFIKYLTNVSNSIKGNNS